MHQVGALLLSRLDLRMPKERDAKASSNHMMLHWVACDRCRLPKGPAVPTTTVMTETRSSEGDIASGGI